MLVKKKMIQNPLLVNFLKVRENMELYDEYCRQPTAERKELLNKRFTQYYFEIRMLSYLSKTIHFEAKRFDAKIRRRNQRCLLILDTSPKESDHTSRLTDFIADPGLPPDPLISNQLEDHIQNPKLHRSVSKLTNRQKEVLYYSFVEEWTDTRIAQKLGVSQQAVTKTRQNALRKIRRDIHD